MDVYRLRLLLPFAEEFRRELEPLAVKAAEQVAASVAEFYKIDEAEIKTNLKKYIEYTARAYLDGLN
mgnify:CR=1 FL=1